MARSEKQKEKLFRILEIFMQRTDDEVGISIPELISVLDSEYGIRAERKSIYDDFLVLSSLGFTVENAFGIPPRVIYIAFFVVGNLMYIICDVFYGRVARLYIFKIRYRFIRFLK